MNGTLITVGAIVSFATVGAGYALHTQVDGLRRDLSALRAERQAAANAPPIPTPTVVRYEVAPAASPSPHAEAAPSGATAASGEPPAPAESPEKRWADDTAAYRTSVEATFAGQTRDHAWAPAARSQLTERLTALIPSSSQLGDVDCRATMCRVAWVDRDPAAGRAFLQKALLDPKDPAWTGPAFLTPSETQADGSTSVVMYLGRDQGSLASSQL